MAHHVLAEWERAPFDHVPEVDAERLHRAAAAPASRLKGKPSAFDFGRDALTAKNLVGIVAAGSTTCEILPKVDRDAPADAPTLRRQLVRMLAVAHDLPIADDAGTALGLQNGTLLEILIARFARELNEAVRRGMPRSYLTRSDDLPALRGRLDVQRQFTTLAAGPQRLACRFDEFSADIALNQVMKTAVSRLRRLARSDANARALGQLALLYDEVSAVPPRALRWEAIVPDRGNARWQGLVRLARLLLGDRFQDSAAGDADGFALLFDMPALFERYIAKLVGGLAATIGCELRSQGGERACLYPETGGAGLFATFPDLQLYDGAGVRMVIDTKWKRLCDPAQDGKMDVSQADVYQLMAYAQLYRCDEVVLLYPGHPGLPGPVLARHRVAAKDGPVRLTVATVDLADHATARASLGAVLASAREDAPA